MEESKVIVDSPNVSPTTVEEEEPSTPPSSSKTLSISPISSPPKSPSVSPMQNPPPSLTKELNPPREIDPEKSPTKSSTKSPTKTPTRKTSSPKEPTTTQKPTDDPNPSSEKTTTEGKTPSTSTPSSKSNKLDKKKFKLKEIVKPDFVPTNQLAELSRAINQESTQQIHQLSCQEKEAHQIWSQCPKKVEKYVNIKEREKPQSYYQGLSDLIDHLIQQHKQVALQLHNHLEAENSILLKPEYENFKNLIDTL